MIYHSYKLRVISPWGFVHSGRIHKGTDRTTADKVGTGTENNIAPCKGPNELYLVPSEIPSGCALRHLLSSRRVLQSIEWHHGHFVTFGAFS